MSGDNAGKQDTNVAEVKIEIKNQNEKNLADNGRPNGNTDHVVSLLEHHDKSATESKSSIPSYAIDPTDQNTTKNPYKETTVTLPHLVRKVPSCDLTPRPWKTFNQVLILSYVSIVFCCFIGAFANRYAWKAKTSRGKGLYGIAQKHAKISAFVSYAAIGCGILMVVIVCSIELSCGNNCH